MAYFTLVLQMEDGLHPRDDPDHFVTEYHGIVRHHNERTGKVSRVGKFRVFRIDTGLASDRRTHLMDVCDCHSEQLYEVCEALFDPEQGFYKEPIVDAFGVTCCDCLVLDYMVIHPRLRGLRLGLLAMLRARRCFGMAAA